MTTTPHTKPRAHVTKSRSGHYTVTLRDPVTRHLVKRIEKLGDIHAARRAIADFNSTQQP